MKSKTNTRLLFVTGPVALFLAVSVARAADIDTTGGTTVLNYDDPENNYLGNGTLQVSAGADAKVELGTSGGVNPTEFAMTGGLISIDSGVTLQNGGWSKGIWDNNKANMQVDGTLDVWDGNPVLVNALTGAGTVLIGYPGGLRSLVVGVNNGTGNFMGTMTGGSGPLSLTKEGSGTQTLSGPTSYNGGTTVNGGRLVLENTITGGVNFTTNAELEFDLTSGDKELINGTFGGTGKLIKKGGSALYLGKWDGPQTFALKGANSVIDFQGGLTEVFYNFNGVPTNSWTGNEAGISVASGATFNMRNGNIFADELNGSGTITKGGFDISNNILTIGVKDGSGTFSGTLQDADWGATMTLVKQGTGTQTLNGTTTYRGGTTVNDGRLVLENTKTGTATFTTNAELEFKVTGGEQILTGGTISGTGKFIKTGGDTLKFGSGSGGVTISLASASLIDVQAGRLNNDYGSNIWSANKADLNVETGATFDVWDVNTNVDAITGNGTIDKGWGSSVTLTIGVDNGSGTFSGPILNGSGGWTLLKIGSGTQTLSGANTYTGATTVSAGTLALVGGSQASPITVNSGASLGFTIGSPTTSTNSFDFIAGSTVTITGTPVSTTLITSSTGITGAPVLSPPIPGFSLVVDVNSLKLVGSAPSGYGTWASTNAPTGTSAQDFDGDGVTNGVEYVLGGTSLTNDLAKLPQVSSSGTNMLVTFNRDQTSINATTTLAIDVGTTLATWPDSYNVPDTALTNIPGVTVNKNTSAGFDTIILTVARTPDAKKFARLKVTTN